jgi:hypothetical protein
MKASQRFDRFIVVLICLLVCAAALKRPLWRQNPEPQPAY